MTEIIFGPPPASAKKVLGAVSGGTGSGKTMSALEIGSGLVADPERHLFLIDTEFGRGAHYQAAYRFQYGQLRPPFRPTNYSNAINAAIAAGAECVIVDSLSHMWEGEDGLLDWHGEIALKMAGGDERRAETYNFPAWRIPKQELNAFVLFLQKCPVHLLLCLRAKERSKMVRVVGSDGRTKTEIVAAGLQPIIDTATPYEATFLAMLSPEDPGVPHWTHKALASYLQHIFEGEPKRLSREHGMRLAQWCGSGMIAPAPAENGDRKADTARGRFMSSLAAAHDFTALAELDVKLSKGQKVLGEHYAECAKALQAKVESMRNAAAETFGEEIDALEPPDWKEAEGRVDDPRQPELLTE